eukprot:4417570-Alexandrium_andersonii.AAC.1
MGRSAEASVARAIAFEKANAHAAHVGWALTLACAGNAAGTMLWGIAKLGAVPNPQGEDFQKA